MLGVVGGILALLGVVAAPITSGDTAFRSARLIVADILGIEQRSIARRLAVCVPLLAAGWFIAQVDFDVVWRYFAWMNQTLAAIVLWSIVVYLARRGAAVVVAAVPAVIMTYVCSSFVFVSGQFFGMENRTAAYWLGGAVTAVIVAMMIFKLKKDAKTDA